MPRIRDRYGLDPDRVPFDMTEVAAAIAPRAFLSISPLRDSNFAVAGVKEAEPRLHAVYALLGAADRLQFPLSRLRTRLPAGDAGEGLRLHRPLFSPGIHAGKVMGSLPVQFSGGDAGDKHNIVELAKFNTLFPRSAWEYTARTL